MCTLVDWNDKFLSVASGYSFLSIGEQDIVTSVKRAEGLSDRDLKIRDEIKQKLTTDIASCANFLPSLFSQKHH